MSMVKHWHRLPRDVAVSAFGESQNPTEKRSDQPAPADCIEDRVGLGISTSAILWFYEGC